ncbi:MAG: sodium:solute symporter family transporter, partial [Sciscionella sp.]
STILGVTALFYMAGHDAFTYMVGTMVGWTLVLFLVGERLRNLGLFTFADACSLRMDEAPIRAFASASTLVVSLLYMIGQMVGAGELVEILFGIPYEAAVLLVGTLMVIYVLFGGMLATTWVQITKAALMMGGGILLGVLVLQRFGFSIDRLLAAAAAAHPMHRAILAPGGLMKSVPDSLSFGLAIALGPAGLPHLLMRFLTVPDARAAQRSVVYGTLLIGLFFLLVPLFGYGAIALISHDPAYLTPAGSLQGGANMAAIHLSAAVGGPIFFGFMSAVVFATVLAVVSGLSLTAATTISHDIFARILRRGRTTERSELLVARSSVVGIGLVAIALALAFKGQNITYMVVLAFSIAASVNVPILLGVMYWPGITTRGATIAGWCGLLIAVVLMILGPTVWVGVLHHAHPLFPLQYPTLVALPITIALVYIVSSLDPARIRVPSARFEEFSVVAEIGFAAGKRHLGSAIDLPPAETELPHLRDAPGG